MPWLAASRRWLTTPSPGPAAGTSSPGTSTEPTGVPFPRRPHRPPHPHRPSLPPRELPGGDVAAFVNARFKGSTDADTWPCYGEVELGLPASDVAPFALDGVVEATGPTRCRMTLGAWSWIGLAAALARFDTDIHVISPPQLKEAFTTLSDRFARSARD